MNPDQQDEARLEILVHELRCLRWALAVIAGLAGALAVHLIFVQDFLPGLVSESTVSPSEYRWLIALSDVLGAALFLVLAAPTLSSGRRGPRVRARLE
jgi:hypothetical protein